MFLAPFFRAQIEVFAWALQRGVLGQVGSNFGQAHRDKSYEDCHSDGRVGMLTTWNLARIWSNDMQ